MPDRSRSFLQNVLLLALIVALGPMATAEDAEPTDRASFQAIPSALPAILDADQKAGETALLEMSEQALQASLLARLQYF